MISLKVADCDCRRAGVKPKQAAGIASIPESLMADGIEGVGLHSVRWTKKPHEAFWEMLKMHNLSVNVL